MGFAIRVAALRTQTGDVFCGIDQRDLIDSLESARETKYSKVNRVAGKIRLSKADFIS